MAINTIIISVKKKATSRGNLNAILVKTTKQTLIIRSTGSESTFIVLNSSGFFLTSKGNYLIFFFFLLILIIRQEAKGQPITCPADRKRLDRDRVKLSVSQKFSANI